MSVGSCMRQFRRQPCRLGSPFPVGTARDRRQRRIRQATSGPRRSAALAGSLGDVSGAPERSPLMTLASMDDDRGAHRDGDARRRPDARPVPHRDRLAPRRGRRQAAASGRRHRRRAGRRRTGHRRRGARRRLVRARPPRVAVPRRRHRRVRHAARRRDGQRQVGQPAGDPRRRLPAVEGVRDRRVARHRGRRAARPHDRLALPGRGRAAPPHVRHRPERGELPLVDQRQDGVPVRDGGTNRSDRRRARPPDRRHAHRVGQRVRHGVPDRRRHPRHHQHERGPRQAGRARHGRGRVHAAGAADAGDGPRRR